jgi:hypothetical protein
MHIGSIDVETAKKGLANDGRIIGSCVAPAASVVVILRMSLKAPLEEFLLRVRVRVRVTQLYPPARAFEL